MEYYKACLHCIAWHFRRGYGEWGLTQPDRASKGLIPLDIQAQQMFRAAHNGYCNKGRVRTPVLVQKRQIPPSLFSQQGIF